MSGIYLDMEIMAISKADTIFVPKALHLVAETDDRHKNAYISELFVAIERRCIYLNSL